MAMISPIALSEREPLEVAMTTTTSNSSASPVTLTIAYTIAGGGSPAPPRIKFLRNQHQEFDTLSTAPRPIIVDYNSTWTVDSPLSGSNPKERWAVPVEGGVALGDTSFTLVFYHQFSESVSYLTLGGEGGLNAKPAVSLCNSENLILFRWRRLQLSGRTPILLGQLKKT